MQQGSGDKKAESKAIRNARFCFWCARAIIDPSVTCCPACGSLDISDRETRPRPASPRQARELTFPWTGIRLKRGGTVILSGDKGSGKTTICLALRPEIILSSEQEPEEVAATFYRVNGEECADDPPLIASFTTWEDIEQTLLGLHEGQMAIIDSISQTSSHHAAAVITRRCIEIVRRRRANAIFICQFNSAGEALGANELQHLVDVVVKIPKDPTGMRRLIVEKDRNGISRSTYFRLGPKGPEEEHFKYAYSVEGPVGQLRLHMYPLGGAKFADALRILAENRVPIEGLASAAVHEPAYMTGFAEPSDVPDRRRFAEEHGLRWVEPEEVQELIQENVDTGD